MAKKLSAKANAYKKIDQLFDYRMIPMLVKSSKIDLKKQFLKDLKRLQYEIYALDEYLEKNWKIKEKSLNVFWKRIFKSLEAFGIKKAKDKRSFCKDILRYQGMEMGLRKGKMPTQKGFLGVYHIKSCDVTLIRRLIYLHDPSLKKKVELSEWTEYDLITEINDDIQDVYEDMKSFNGNRFLISLIKWGTKKTGKDYVNALKKVGQDYKKKKPKARNSRMQKQLAVAGKKQLKGTLKLLKKRLGQKTIKRVKKAWIAKYV
jgi:hypothetical protein